MQGSMHYPLLCTWKPCYHEHGLPSHPVPHILEGINQMLLMAYPGQVGPGQGWLGGTGSGQKLGPTPFSFITLHSFPIRPLTTNATPVSCPPSSHSLSLLLLPFLKKNFVFVLVLWQNGACRGGKLQQGNYIIQRLPGELMELHSSLLIISLLGSNYMLETFGHSTNSSSSNSHGLWESKGLNPTLDIVLVPAEGLKD